VDHFSIPSECTKSSPGFAQKLFVIQQQKPMVKHIAESGLSIRHQKVGCIALFVNSFQTLHLLLQL
jgi:hypothetical protein